MGMSFEELVMHGGADGDMLPCVSVCRSSFRDHADPDERMVGGVMPINMSGRWGLFSLCSLVDCCYILH